MNVPCQKDKWYMDAKSQEVVNSQQSQDSADAKESEIFGDIQRNAKAVNLTHYIGDIVPSRPALEILRIILAKDF